MRKLGIPVFVLCSFLQAALPLAHAATKPEKVPLKAVPLPLGSRHG